MIRKLITIFLLATTLILTACNVGATAAPTVDINAINTAALGTAMAQISAQQTMTALAAPTFTPSPTTPPPTLATVALPTTAGALPTSAGGALPTVSFNTTAVANTAPAVGFTAVGGAPSVGSVCNNLAYVADATIPDGTVFDGGEDFTKTWQVQNTGSCKWDEGYKLVYMGGDDELDPVTVRLQRDDFLDSGAVGELSVNLTAPLKAGRYTGTWQMQADNGEYFGTELTVVIEVE
jgi:hypothetical protein